MIDRQDEYIMCKLHELRILPIWFKAMMSEGKDFEIRFNDRDFNAGDQLLLREWDVLSSYTGNYIKAKIKYVYHGTGEYGLSKDWCILGLADIVCIIDSSIRR